MGVVGSCYCNAKMMILKKYALSHTHTHCPKLTEKGANH